MNNPATFSWRHTVLLLTVFGSLVLSLSLTRLVQDPDYHLFADQRSCFGIRHCLNVLSNLPFLLVGAAGVYYGLKQRGMEWRIAWLTFFSGVTLISTGSAWYHWQPDSTTLVWDRLPMTIAFMGLGVALLAEFVQLSRAAGWLLVAALLTGLSSVLYWQRYDDLRLYIWVQALPLLIIPVVVLLFPRRYSHYWLLLVALSCYLAAKLFEFTDRATLELTHGLVSGHTIKHLFAALACYLVLVMLKNRKPIGPTGRPE